jgi:hypothetical protein
VVSKIKELCKSLCVIWNLLFKCCVDFLEFCVYKIGFRVIGIKEVHNLMKREELLFATTSLVLLINAFLTNSRLCFKVGSNVCCEGAYRVSNFL